MKRYFLIFWATTILFAGTTSVSFAQDGGNLFPGKPNLNFWYPPYASEQPSFEEGIYTIDLKSATDKPMAVVKIELPPGLENGNTYLFSFQVKAKPSSALIVTVPQSDASGKKDGQGNPAPASDWGQCWDQWKERTVEFDYDENMSDKLQFFWNQAEIGKGAEFQFKDFTLKKIE